MKQKNANEGRFIFTQWCEIGYHVCGPSQVSNALMFAMQFGVFFQEILTSSVKVAFGIGHFSDIHRNLTFAKRFDADSMRQTFENCTGETYRANLLESDI